MADKSSEKILNPEQLEAIKHGEGSLLIIAGAGRGKMMVVSLGGKIQDGGEN